MRRVQILVLLVTLQSGLVYCQEPSAKSEPNDINSPPRWLTEHQFGTREFVFARAKYRSMNWANDYPDADAHFVGKLNTITNLTAKSEVVPLDTVDKVHPSLIYFCKAEEIEFNEAETNALRKYYKKGGFAVFDDTWGRDALENITHAITELLPEYQVTELTVDHPLFQSVFNFVKLPQVPSLNKFLGRDDQYPRKEFLATTHPVKYLGVSDESGRLMVLICHNTDMADGWERDQDVAIYKRMYSDTVAYPLGVNIVFYVLSPL